MLQSFLQELASTFHQKTFKDNSKLARNATYECTSVVTILRVRTFLQVLWTFFPLEVIILILKAHSCVHQAGCWSSYHRYHCIYVSSFNIQKPITSSLFIAWAVAFLAPSETTTLLSHKCKCGAPIVNIVAISLVTQESYATNGEGNYKRPALNSLSAVTNHVHMCRCRCYWWPLPSR